MSAHIPPERHIIHGRTWDREWHPEAIEHHRVRARHIARIAWPVACILSAIAIGAIAALGV